MSNYICNAVIESADITLERGFILSCNLSLTYGNGTGQGFGGYSLYLTSSGAHHANSKKFNYAGIYISRVMEIAGVENWNELKGRTIRVTKEDEWGEIISIGHIVKHDWFNPKTDMKAP